MQLITFFSGFSHDGNPVDHGGVTSFATECGETWKIKNSTGHDITADLVRDGWIDSL